MYTGNILWEQKKFKFHLIDFEYVAPNFLGMDLINFVDELLCDYTHPEPPYFKVSQENIPNSADLKEMVHFYLFMYYHMDQVRDMEIDDEFIDKVKGLPTYVGFDQQLVERYMALIPLYGMLINAYWFWWGLYNLDRKIGFDFVEFSKVKYDLFIFFKTLKL